jgi:hypothetical protein
MDLTQLSRRRFLQLAGITFLGSYFDPGQFWRAAEPYPLLTHGRALAATPVYAAPTQHSALITYLWPDSIIDLQDTIGNWYQTSTGFAQRICIQPITLYPVTHNLLSLPAWAEVVSPVATVRGWCAADAPLVTRIGHGGVAQVIDYLPADSLSDAWYGIATDSGDPLGWSQAVHWGQPPKYLPPLRGNLTLEINQIKQHLHVNYDRTRLLTTPVSTSQPLLPGHWSLTRYRPAGSVTGAPHRDRLIHGAPWQFQLDNHLLISGVYWHNAFGQPVETGPAVQLPALVARWLYHIIVDKVSVTIT